jgi:Xaa-Pro aminopeptidase
MLTETGCRARLEQLWKALDPSLEAVLLTDPSSLTWAVNYRASPFVFNSQEAVAALLAWRGGRSLLIADNVQRAFAEQAFATDRFLPEWYRCTASAPHRRRLLAEAILEKARLLSTAVLGFEPSSCPAAVAQWLPANRPEMQFHDVEPVLRRLRRAKQPDELDLIGRSAQAAQAALAEARAQARAGMTELDLFRVVQSAAARAAGMPVEVYGDFVSGPRCEHCGGPPSARRIGAGELILLDFSVVLHGYRADFCDTFACQAELTPRQSEIRAACLAAMGAGEQLLKAGTAACGVYAAVRDSLARDGLAEHFPHHAGHGVGLGHPEPPYFVPRSEETLLAGDVVTLEPGVYIEGALGMRFEHCYAITDGGFERLTHHL